MDEERAKGARSHLVKYSSNNDYGPDVASSKGTIPADAQKNVRGYSVVFNSLRGSSPTVARNKVSYEST